MLKAVTQLVMPGVVAEEEAEVADHLADMGLDAVDSIYSDSLSDAPMAQIAKTSFMVRHGV